MSLDSSNRPSRNSSGQDLWPKWMWIAVPVLVVVVVAGLWWALLSPPEQTTPKATATPTQRPIVQDPTAGPTEVSTLVALPEGTPGTLPTTPLTFTPTTVAPVVTPSAQAVEAAGSEELAMGAKAVVTAGAGLNMRSGAGTGHSRVKTLGKGVVLEIVGGPQEADGYTWWQVRDDAGTTGWVVSEFINAQK